MNIREAKEEITRSVEVYLEKNEDGEYQIPTVKQRPIFMVGAPGIGKTAVMEQISSELDIALVSYSMTHHTRQSALGLPFIEERQFGGEKAMVSEYTMSEIIASVYKVMEESGKKEGILFLDEINCVSETLAPAMLLFLQYKIFGNRKLPEGWVVVTAGNPPQYNKSVKEFDVATLDRLKCLTVEEDFGVWKSYAYQNGIHAAVVTFLEINPDWFYAIRTTVEGTQYVTARGWEDLSRIISVYEKKKFKVDKRLVQQYITNSEVAAKFSIYYDLFQKYQSSYQVEDILKGISGQELQKRAAGAGFDERVSLLGLILENLNRKFAGTVSREAVLERVVKILRQLKKVAAAMEQGEGARLGDQKVSLALSLRQHCLEVREERDDREAAGSLSPRLRKEYREVLALLDQYMEECDRDGEAGKLFRGVKKKFDAVVKKHHGQVQEAKQALENVFSFMERVWGQGQEMILFVTELTANADSMHFIEMWGSDAYFQYNQELLVGDVRRNLQREIAELGI